PRPGQEEKTIWRDQEENRGGHSDRLDHRVPGLFSDPIELPKRGQRDERRERIESRGRQPEQNRQDDGDRDRRRDLALVGNCHPFASNAVIPSLFLSVILSEAKDLLSSFRVAPSSSGQALSDAKDLL